MYSQFYFLFVTFDFHFQAKKRRFQNFFQSDSQSETTMKGGAGSNPGGGNIFCNQFPHFNQFYSNTTNIFPPNLTLAQDVLPLSVIRKCSDICQIYGSDIVC